MFTAAIARPDEVDLNRAGMRLVEGLVRCNIDAPDGGLDMPLPYFKCSQSRRGGALLECTSML